jgi:esterase/lipase superfamily enzyme
MLGAKCLFAPVCIVFALALSACAGRPLQGVLIPVAQSAEGSFRVQVLAATTRRRSADAGEMFGGGRAEDMSYASVTVSIPPDNVRKTGEISVAGIPPR